MEKFSLYEFMSFFLPGVMALYIAQQLIPQEYILFHPVPDFINGLVFTILAVLTGLILHRATFWFTRYTWYKKWTMRSIQQIIKENPKDIEVNFKKIHLHHLDEQLESEYLFDKAYYYLEYHDKIASSKTFQSMYFFIRNLITLSILLIPVVMIITIFKEEKMLSLVLLGSILLVQPFLKSTANFYRMKMVERIVNTYSIAIETKKEK